MPPRRIHDQVADPQTGYILNPARSFFSIVVPEETINLITDPHAELATSYFYTGTVTLQTAVQRRSRRAWKLISANGNGIGFSLPAKLTANQYYTFSIDLLGLGDFSIYFASSSSAVPVELSLVHASGVWERVSITRFIRTGEIDSVSIIARTAQTWYTDGWQLENKAYPTTFASGSLASNVRGAAADYAWLGAPNRAVSFRSANTFDGGRVIPLSDLGFDVMSFLEFGYGSQTNQFEDYATRNGALYTGTRADRRSFTLLGNIQSDTLRQLLHKRFSIGQAIMGGSENARPIKLLCQLYDCDMPVSEELEITAVYKSGLGGNTDNLYQEKASIVFETGDALLAQSGVTASTLTLETTLASAAGIIAVQGNGIVTATGIPGDPGYSRGMVIGPDNNLYFVRTNVIVQYNGITATTIYAAASGFQITALTVAPDGKLYFATISNSGLSNGALTSIDLTTGSVSGVSGTVTNLIGPIRALKPGRNGELYIGGLFSTIQNSVTGTISARNVASLDLATGVLSAMDTGLGTDTSYGSLGVLDFAVDNNGWVWACGEFSNGNVVATDIHHIALWTGAAWQKVGNFSSAYPATITNIKACRVNKLAYDSVRDIMYIGGKFQIFSSQETVSWVTSVVSNICAITRSDGIPAFGIAGGAPVYTGTHTVTKLGYSGLTYRGHHPTPSYNGEVIDMSLSCSGELAVAGDFAFALNDPATVTLSNFALSATGLALWDPNGKHWIQTPFSIPNGTSAPYLSYVIRTVEYGGNCGSGNNQAADFTLGSQGFSSLLSATFLSPGSADAFFFDVGTAVNITSVYVNTVDNGQSVSARPVFEIAGPGTIEFIRNLTTGKTIVFNNKSLFASETLTVDTRTDSNGVYSSTQGDQTFVIDRNCSFPAFELVPGLNQIVVKVSSAGASTRVTMRWKKRYASMDALGLEASEL
jgi:hypothetical protein